MDKELTKYDKVESFNKECKPLLEKLALHCSLNNIPFFFTAAVKNDEKGTLYQSDIVGVGSKNLTLKDDKISKHIAVQSGFDVIPKKEEIEIDMDEIMPTAEN